MEPMTIQELADATGATLLGEGISPDQTITGVETDSRAVHPGDLFVALPGEKTDGHKFIPGALEAGAVACLTQQAPEKPLPGKEGGPYILPQGAFYRLLGQSQTP